MANLFQGAIPIPVEQQHSILSQFNSTGLNDSLQELLREVELKPNELQLQLSKHYEALLCLSAMALRDLLKAKWNKKCYQNVLITLKEIPTTNDYYDLKFSVPGDGEKVKQMILSSQPRCVEPIEIQGLHFPALPKGYNLSVFYDPSLTKLNSLKEILLHSKLTEHCKMVSMTFTPNLPTFITIATRETLVQLKEEVPSSNTKVSINFSQNDLGHLFKVSEGEMGLGIVIVKNNFPTSHQFHLSNLTTEGILKIYEEFSKSLSSLFFNDQGNLKDVWFDTAREKIKSYGIHITN